MLMPYEVMSGLNMKKATNLMLSPLKGVAIHFVCSSWLKKKNLWSD